MATLGSEYTKSASAVRIERRMGGMTKYRNWRVWTGGRCQPESIGILALVFVASFCYHFQLGDAEEVEFFG
jgi:hypothetical protein